MKRLHIYSFAILGGLALLISSCKQEQQQAPQQQALSLAVTEVSQKSVTAYTTYPTAIEGIINSEVRAKVSGYIQKVFVDESQKRPSAF